LPRYLLFALHAHNCEELGFLIFGHAFYHRGILSKHLDINTKVFQIRVLYTIWTPLVFYLQNLMQGQIGWHHILFIVCLPYHKQRGEFRIVFKNYFVCRFIFWAPFFSLPNWFRYHLIYNLILVYFLFILLFRLENWSFRPF
jgi:hypothetical protein